MKNVINNECKSICAECKGNCCRHIAGIYHPDQIKAQIGDITYESLKKFIDTGKVSIDWYEDIAEFYEFDDEDIKNLDNRVGPEGYYLRPRHLHSPIIDPSFGGCCIHWSLEKGCELSFEKRPLECQLFIPGSSRVCEEYYDSSIVSEHFGKKEAYKAWLRYWSILDKLRFEYDETL